jgi:sporulation protein YlmC with PRC-barrel domain
MGLRVVRHDSEEVLGKVEDVVVHPTSGRALALVVRGEDGRRRAFRQGDWFLEDGVVMTKPHTMISGEALGRLLERGVLAIHDLLGKRIVRDEASAIGYVRGRGQDLGSIRDVVLLPGRPRVVYSVANPLVRAGGFFLAGSVPSSYSRADDRLEVPRRADSKYAAPSPARALELAAM